MPEFDKPLHALSGRLAARAVEIACKDLGLVGDCGCPVVKIRWVGMADIRNMSPGFARSSRPDEIQVRYSIDPTLAAEVAAHEVRHLWQYKHRRFDPQTYTYGYVKAKHDGEMDAQAYGRRIAEQANAEFETGLMLYKVRQSNERMRTHMLKLAPEPKGTGFDCRTTKSLKGSEWDELARAVHAMRHEYRELVCSEDPGADICDVHY